MKNEDFKIGDLVQLPTEVKGHIKRKKEIFATITLLDEFIEKPKFANDKPIKVRICKYENLIKL